MFGRWGPTTCAAKKWGNALKNKLSSTVGTFLAGVLALTLAVPAPAAVAADPGQKTRLQNAPAAESVGVTAFDRMPVMETGTVGELPVDADGTMALVGAPDGSALLRISVFRPAEEVSVSAAGAPALEARAGADSSTTVLVPVHNGRVPVSASSAVTARVELLAHFENNPLVPGATIALPMAVNRVDSTARTGIGPLTAEPQSVSVVGIGGVPSTDVRAVHLTAAFDLPSSGTVAISGQKMELPRGRSVVTTIAPVDQSGSIQLSSSKGGEVSADVRGWVVGANEGMAAANVTGSYVPSNEHRWSNVQTGPGESANVTLPGTQDRALGVALVAASAVKSGQRSFVNVGDAPSGRSRGVLADAQQGALPQIELIESSAGETLVSTRGGATHVRLMPLGDILGEKSLDPSPVAVTIVAPESADLADTGTIELSGTVKSEAAVDSVHIYGNGDLIGTAAIDYAQGQANWHLTTAAPSGGKTVFRAKAFVRDGGSGEATATTQIMMPASGDVIVGARTVVVEAKQILELTPGQALFAEDPRLIPGDVMVAAVSAGAPEGALSRVIAVQKTANGWVVTTEQAALTDAFVQAKQNGQYSALSEGTEILPANPANEDTEVVDDGVANVSLANVKLADPFVVANHKSSRSALPRADLKTVLQGTAKLAVPFDGKGKTKDVSRATPAKQAQAKKKVKLEGGMTFDAEVEVWLGVVLDLDIQVDWGWGSPVPKLKYFKTAFNGGYKYEYAANISGSAKAEFSKELANLRSAPITIPVGIVPVVLAPGATITISGEANGEYSVSFADSYEKTFEYGAEFRDDSWNPISDVSSNGPENPGGQCLGWGQKVTADGQLDGKLKLAIAGNVKIYGVIGPEVTLNTGVEASIAAKLSGAEGTFTVSSQRALLLGADLGINAEMNVLGFKIGDKWSYKVADVRIPLWETDDVEFALCASDDDDGEDGEDGDDDRVLVHGTVSSASTTEPISGATVTITDSTGAQERAVSDGMGGYEIVAAPGELSVVAEAEGYITYTGTATVEPGAQRLINIRMSTRMEGTQYRAVLTWGENPRDLDSHLVGIDSAGSYHVYYAEKYARHSETREKIAELDVDNTSGFGPETTTFTVQPDGDYTFFVHNYTGNTDEMKLSTSGGNVVLYRGEEKVGEYDIPVEGDGLYWNVFSIRDGKVMVANEISDTPARSENYSMRESGPERNSPYVTQVPRRVDDSESRRLLEELADVVREDIQTGVK